MKSDVFFNARNQAEIYGMSEDRDGDLWISTIDSVYLYNPELTRLERVLGNDEEQSVIYEGVFIGDDNVVLIKSSRGYWSTTKAQRYYRTCL
ncbi:two-component regulator propeller domain-containing protein [Pseudoalteromonas piscicida]|uniref:two-component regulator propeller domain-containing protein n=1 Tax=Pseudoalteromonas piscicida TaxID=43662 RepID=UPI003981FB2B